MPLAEKAVPKRLQWAVETLDLAPSDRVLEIGCGRGIAATLVCERLKDGALIAIDRSEKAIEAARQRNHEHAATGKAAFNVIALEGADFSEASFDKIFAVNVNLFWVRSPERELKAIRRWLAPGGRVYLYWEPPGGGAEEIAGKVVPALEANGFEVGMLKNSTTGGAELCCVMAQ